MNDIFSNRPFVKSLCIKCMFNKGINLDGKDKSPGMNTAELVDDKYKTKKVLIPGTFICSNPESEMYNSCIVGHLGCEKVSQIQEMDDYSKEQILLIVKGG